MSVSFEDHYVRSIGTSVESLRVGRAVNASIPIPAVDHGGLRDAALWWATVVGWKIFPLREANPDPTDRHAGKVTHPAIKHPDPRGSFTEWTIASCNEDWVRAWWMAYPLANVGVVTLANGLLVVDVDPRSGGWESLRALCDRHAIGLDDVPRSISPRGDGGCHLWWRLPKDRHGDGVYRHSSIARGLDRPWQVPVPPSVRLVTTDSRKGEPSHEFRSYGWETGDPRALPDAPSALLGEPEHARGPDDTVSPDLDGSSADENGRIDVTALRRTGVPVGEQSYTFKRMACSLVSRGLCDDAIAAVLFETARTSPVGDLNNPWTEHDLRKTTQSARRFVEHARRDVALSNEERATVMRLGKRLMGHNGEGRT